MQISYTPMFFGDHPDDSNFVDPNVAPITQKELARLRELCRLCYEFEQLEGVVREHLDDGLMVEPGPLSVKPCPKPVEERHEVNRNRFHYRPSY